MLLKVYLAYDRTGGASALRETSKRAMPAHRYTFGYEVGIADGVFADLNCMYNRDYKTVVTNGVDGTGKFF